MKLYTLYNSHSQFIYFFPFRVHPSWISDSLWHLTEPTMWSCGHTEWEKKQMASGMICSVQLPSALILFLPLLKKKLICLNSRLFPESRYNITPAPQCLGVYSYSTSHLPEQHGQMKTNHCFAVRAIWFCNIKEISLVLYLYQWLIEINRTFQNLSLKTQCIWLTKETCSSLKYLYDWLRFINF